MLRACLHARSTTWQRAHFLMFLVGQQSTDAYSWAACILCGSTQPARAECNWPEPPSARVIKVHVIGTNPTANCRPTVVETFWGDPETWNCSEYFHGYPSSGCTGPSSGRSQAKNPKLITCCLCLISSTGSPYPGLVSSLEV